MPHISNELVWRLRVVERALREARDQAAREGADSYEEDLFQLHVEALRLSISAMEGRAGSRSRSRRLRLS